MLRINTPQRPYLDPWLQPLNERLRQLRSGKALSRDNRANRGRLRKRKIKHAKPVAAVAMA